MLPDLAAETIPLVRDDPKLAGWYCGRSWQGTSSKTKRSISGLGGRHPSGAAWGAQWPMPWSAAAAPVARGADPDPPLRLEYPEVAYGIAIHGGATAAAYSCTLRLGQPELARDRQPAQCWGA